MENEAPKAEQKYCVVAASRDDNIRHAITGAMSRARADEERDILNRTMKKIYKYFHVAKYPYAPSLHGTGGSKITNDK